MKKKAALADIHLSLGATLCIVGLSAHSASAATDAATVEDNARKARPAKVATAMASSTASGRAQARVLAVPSAEEVSVSAERIIGKSATSPSTPVHSTTQVTVVSGAQLTATGQSNVMQALAQLSPAINAPPMPGGGNNGFTQSMQLRGLSADQTLILVNGHRRHIGANFNALVGPQWGTEPADIALIPISAIDHVEVITEGATALYGQDAMAGAVNIVLKSDTHGGTVNFKNSGFYGGDGQALDGSANLNFALGRQGGYLDLSAQVLHQLPAFRNGDYINPSRYPYDTYYALPDGSVDPRASRSRDVQRSNALSKRTVETVSENMGLPITRDIELYSTGTYGHRTVDVGQTYRSAADDLTVTALWPNGMAPYYVMAENDFEVDDGFKGHTFGFAWDTYVNYGKDAQSYEMKDTDNASYGTASKTRFHTGSATASELSAGFKASRNFRLGFLPKPVSLEFGAEYRRDTFALGAGEYASYADGGVPILTGPDAGRVATPGAATHAGNPASVAGNYTRDVYDGHVNLDFFLTDKWEWTLGGRTVAYHNYPVVTTGAVGTRYNFTDRWAVRANINTGYRPPTLGQTYYYYSSPNASYSILSLPNNSAAARALGDQKLKGEYSRSFSIGVDATPLDDWHLTGNLYYIAINDRLASTPTLGGTFVAQTLAQYNLGNATYASYYANPVNTNTWGGDLATDYTLRTPHYGNFRFAFSVNFSDNEIRSFNKTPAVLAANNIPYFNAYAVAELIHASPKNRENLSVRWTRGKWSVMVEEQRYGSSVFIVTPSLPTNLWTVQRPAFLTNLEVGYNILPYWHVAVGANNLFNKYPTRVQAAATASSFNMYKYAAFSPFGYFGGMYYVNTSINF
ncbi:TonB-dependent receptor plug domain-containing protein [Gluconacetobacter asukensis]|uniref:TonB-dependent receptor n=1 Tax=Gluconacetobacter asukensis TaxID=1017181 RepID=A0A7W4P1K6_9PROT|nr:TonB-dependent receptor [Gluconacetobacter asukensis]MBB2171853.1 TonB-dependent receptor [Gluconacetobacter asukensis]